MTYRALAPSPQPQHAVAAGHGVVRGHVVTAVKLLRERIAEPWTLNSLAQEVHLSRSQLVRPFDATTGLSQQQALTWADQRQNAGKRLTRTLNHDVEGSSKTRGVELRGLEPLAFWMQTRRSSS